MNVRVHHSAIVVRDFEASLRFWRDGVGLVPIMDEQFDGDWVTLFGAPSTRLRSIFLGDPERPDAGIIELVQFVPLPDPDPAGPVNSSVGFFLLSCYVDVDAVLERLAALGLGGEPRRISAGPDGGVQMATVIDPDAVLVELIGIPAP